jgi:hypothetical protein
LFALIFITAAETGLRTFLPECEMACCQSVVSDTADSIMPSCCRTPEIEPCNCKFQLPLKTEAEPVPRTETKITITHAVYEKTAVKCSFCIVPDQKYGFKKDIYLYYLVSESEIFSGRAPPLSI